VAGTNGGNVNCSSVDILLSLDGGQTFTVVLATNTPNDGSETITVPSNINTPNGRYMVKGHNNYFFDVNKGNLTIGNYTTTCNTFSDSPNVAIPDNDPNGVSSTIQINNSVSISDLNLTVNITHTYVNDLRIKLTSPQGTEVYVWDRNCGGQDNLNITFDDEASNAIDCNNTEAGNTYLPANALTAFDGEDSQGTWTLTVSDHYNQDTGTLNSWSLEICNTQLSAETSNIDRLEIYPVPSSTFVTVSFVPKSGTQQITVTDLNGRIIYRTVLNENANVTHKINVSKWAKGIYLFNITDGIHKAVQKVIVK
jgi:subtilisin-like proprotein convertase family protein